MSSPAQDMKVAIVVDAAMPAGLAANTAAVLALTLGRRFEALVGHDLKDGDGSVHPGITTVPMPILTADTATIRSIRDASVAGDGLFVVDFTNCAQRTRTYGDYAEQLEASTGDAIVYLGVALCGPKKMVQKLTGSLPLMR
jgi:hypothetical protein